MDDSLAMHTAARRYCMMRHEYWSERYSEIERRCEGRALDGYQYSSIALDTFPRYNVTNAILVEVERIDTDALIGVERMISLLLSAGETAQDAFTEPPQGDIESRAMNQERKAYAEFVRAFQPSDFTELESLPYRRVLTPVESQAIWSALRDRWKIPAEYWYPLADCPLPDVVAFRSVPFHEAVGAGDLRTILRLRGIERIWVLREHGPEYSQDTAALEPHYNGAEGYWTSDGMDWILYASHEGSITAGGWLAEEVKAMWPAWREHFWTGIRD